MEKQKNKGRNSRAANLKEQQESSYTAKELADNAQSLFKVRSECVIAALRSMNIEKCTVSKAKEIVEKFMKKEVK